MVSNDRAPGGYVLELRDADRSRLADVGGKAAALGELSRLEGVEVPDGFCVTTAAFRRFREGGSAAEMPDDVGREITAALARFDPQTAWAVRSSATAEDLPAASFAGQYDTWLNVVGTAEVLEHVRRCWVSLFSERAVAYRRRNGLDDRPLEMAVLVQVMVPAGASGMLFTADPVSSNRRIAVVEAVPGLGEALVSGRVNPDVFRVRDGQVVDQSVTHETLTEAQAVRLLDLGRRIEAHFGEPQDIEWCRLGDEFRIVQSRPITTLFPLPTAPDEQRRVYISVGHQQMMTDALKPLGLSVWQLTAARPMAEAGGRLFVDVTQALASPASRAGLLALAGRSDPLLGDALQRLVERGDFVTAAEGAGPPSGLPVPGAAPPLEPDPALVTGLMEQERAALEAARQAIATKSGPALFDFILSDLQTLKRFLFDPVSLRAIMASIEAAWWLNERLEAWLGVKNAADALAQSAPNNVTSEMGLALLDVADAIRPHPAVVARLEQRPDDTFLQALDGLPGGPDARAAIETWLDRYGARGPGEIDLTRPRWREAPSMLLPLILAHVRRFEPGEAQRRFDQGRNVAQQTAETLLARLRALPDGAQKAEETARAIERLRAFAGYREFPKYAMVGRYFVYKQALLREAERLAQARVLSQAEDIFFLRFEELHEVSRTHRVDPGLLRARKAAFRRHEALTPPRVFTSEGEVVAGAWRRADLPPDALVGLPVSAGTVEGRARVVLDMAGAELGPDDILVTTFTDPSWTPVFVGLKGLVTEVGGLMTHGAVIAREYGLPAVVCVEGATRLIRDGQRIRVHGTDGYVEILD